VKVILALLVISGLAWSGFFLFTQGLFQDEEALVVEIEGPEEVRSGEEVSYTIRYENRGSVPIASLIAKLNLPSTFHVYETIPEADSTDEWNIGSLSAGSDSAITITGVFLAEVESSQRIQILFTYKPANFSSDFQEIVTHKVDVTDSVVDLTLSGPEKALAGDETEYIINIQNSNTDPVYNLRVIPLLPTDFTITETDPTIQEGESAWMIDVLSPGELKALTFRGSFTSSASGDQTVGASVGFVSEDLTLAQATEELITDVLGGTIGFSMVINGSEKDQNAAAGETLRLSINFQNNGEEIIEDMGFELTLSSASGIPIDWESANLGGGTRSGNTLTFSGATHDALETLEPGQEEIIDLSLPILEELSEAYADNFTIGLKALLTNIGGVASTREIESTPITISISSTAVVSAHARYYTNEGTPVGSGPLPLEVGETTSFRVYWNITNGLHDLDNVKFTTTLPQDVAWLDETDVAVGALEFNETARQLTWTIPRLPTSIPSAGAWFSVAVNPSEDDVGRFMKLTNTTSFTGTDSETGEQLTKTIEQVTTSLSLDELAAGEGIVIE